MSKKVIPSIAGLLFSLGSGFIFFGLGYEYRKFDIVTANYQTFYQIFFIVMCFIVGSAFIIGGAYLLTKVSNSRDITENRLRQIVREEVILALGFALPMTIDKLEKGIKASSSGDNNIPHP